MPDEVSNFSRRSAIFAFRLTHAPLILTDAGRKRYACINLNYFNYFTEIEDTFVRRRNRHLLLSPLDWALIEGWKERGIPLHIVIRSIESVFDVYDKQPPGTRAIKTLFYCREEVEVQYEEWLRSRAGRSEKTDEDEKFSPQTVTDHIAKAIETLKANTIAGLEEDIQRAVTRLDELNANLPGDGETIDSTLRDIEKLLERAMLTKWEKSHLKQLEKDVAGQLRAYKAEMEPDAYKNTYELMLLKRLREEGNIPRLGLFYL